MPSFHAFLRLLWRPATPFSIFILGCMCLFLGWAAVGLESTLRWTAEARAAGFDEAILEDLRVVLPRSFYAAAVLVLAPAAAGALAGSVIMELLYCPFAWMLPDLRRALVVPDLAFGFVVCALAATFHVENGAEATWLPSFCLAVLCFAVGQATTDLLPGRTLGWLLTAGFLAVLARVAVVAELLAERPLLVGLPSLVLAAVLLARTFRVERARTKALVPSSRLGWEVPVHGAAALSRGPRRGSRGTWSGGRLRPRAGDWVRAFSYEHFGSARRGGIVMTMVAALVTALWLVGIVYVLGFREGSSPWLGLRWVAHVLYDPAGGLPLGHGDPPRAIPALIAASAMGMHALATPEAFSSGLPYPVSRRQRARIAWWLGFVEAAAIAVALVAALALAGELVLRALGSPRLPGRLPEFVRSVLVAVLFLPAIQVFRLTMLSRLRRATAGTIAATLFVVLGLYVLVVGLVATGWREVPSTVPAGVQLAVALVLVLGSQSLYAERLRQHYQRSDLT